MPLETMGNAKPIAGGMFRATVPATIEFIPAATDPDPLDHTVFLTLDVRQGRLVCTECRVKANPQGPPVTADAIRRVPVGRYIRHAVDSDPVLVMEVDPSDPSITFPFVAPPKNFAEGGMSDEVLREVSHVYHWALATGDAPLGVLERDYGIKRSKASRWITIARRRGFIKDDEDGS